MTESIYVPHHHLASEKAEAGSSAGWNRIGFEIEHFTFSPPPGIFNPPVEPDELVYQLIGFLFLCTRILAAS